MNPDLLPYINLIGILVIGGSYVFVQWRTGSGKVSSEVITAYRTQVEQLREELKIEKSQITALQLRIATMEGANVEKDKKIKEYTEIFQGKNPDQTAYMNKTLEILTEIKNFMQGLNEKSQTNENRNIKIDANLKGTL